MIPKRILPESYLMKFSQLNIIYTKSILLLILGLIFHYEMTAQKFQELDIPVKIDGRTLRNPFAGGVAAAQFSSSDINNDGIMDIWMFDRVGPLITPLIGYNDNGVIRYRYGWSGLSNYPQIGQWALLRDINGDGIDDIFNSDYINGTSYVELYLGQSDGSFEAVSYPGRLRPNVIYAERLADGKEVDIYVPFDDIPAIDDIDGDGDLDMLTFENLGSTVTWYRNMSVEDGNDLSDFRFVIEDDCWGKMYEAEFSKELTLSTSPDECAEPFTKNPNGLRHAGSTLCTFDQDRDGDKELVLGDISSSGLVFLKNGGTPEKAWMTDQDTSFPSYDQSAELPIFLSSFILDYNQDGTEDFVVTVNEALASEDVENQWYYIGFEHQGELFFSLENKNLFGQDMIDLGFGALPTFFDYNGDGLSDLIVGNASRYENTQNYSSQVYLFENVGTATQPAFELVNEDFLELRQYSQDIAGLGAFACAAGDIDGDGDDDLLFGNSRGTIIFAENSAGPGQAPQFEKPVLDYLSIDVGSFSVPSIFDVNGDGLNDLVFGRRQGTTDANINACSSLIYYQNEGSSGNPVFETDMFAGNNNSCFGNRIFSKFGGSKVYGAPRFKQLGGETRIYMGTNQGIKVMTGIDADADTVFDIIDDELGDIFTYTASLIADLQDIDNDGYLEMVVGFETGGLRMYKTDHRLDGAVSNRDANKDVSWKVFPNPSSGYFQIKGLSDVAYELHDISGKLIKKGLSTGQKILTDGIPEGIYFLSITTNDRLERQTQKLIIR